VKYTIGIDNGLDGAVVVLCDGKLHEWHDTPTIAAAKGKGKRAFAVAEMVSILRPYTQLGEPEAFLEYAQAMPKQGVSSTFKTGVCFGLWQGILSTLGISFNIVHPRTWTGKMLHGMPAGDTKARSMARCQQLFPSLPLMKPRGRVLSMDGRADAALIAAHGAGIGRPE